MVDLTLVVPCHNEQDVIETTTARLMAILEQLHAQGEISANTTICYVDDGSSDQTWALIESLASRYRAVMGVRLSRNFGHQAALLAGLMQVQGEVVISLDADLQDDPAVIAEMVAAYQLGNDVVFGVRRQREADTWFKRATAWLFYRLMHVFGVGIVPDHADYRLMSRRAIEALQQYREVNLFLRGIIPLMGFRSSTVFYHRHARQAGQSKYPLRRMLSFAWQGITSFSAIPLRMITLFGVVVFFASLGVTLWALWVKLMGDSAVPGWASTVVPLYLLGGVQLLGIGVLGEYLAKIYMETKQRPRYFIERVITHPDH